MLELGKTAQHKPSGSFAKLKEAAQSLRRNNSRNNLRNQTLSQVIEEDEHSFDDDPNQMTEAYKSFPTQQQARESYADLTTTFQKLEVNQHKAEKSKTRRPPQANSSRALRPSKNLRHAASKPVYRQRAFQSTPNLTSAPRNIDDMMRDLTVKPRAALPSLVISAHFVYTNLSDKLAPSTSISIDDVPTAQAFWDKAHASLGSLGARADMFQQPSVFLFTVVGVTGTMQCEMANEKETNEMYEDFLGRCKNMAQWTQEQEELVAKARKRYVIGGGATDGKKGVVAGEIYIFFGELA